MIKGKFRVSDGGMIFFWCKACKMYHGVCIDKDKYHWDFNGDYNNPTIRPSILVTDPQGTRCHSFVTDGKIQYLNDCSHDLKNQEVELDIPEESRIDLKYNVVVITSYSSIPEDFLGRYGVIVEYAYGDKWLVELQRTTEIAGCFRHTVSEKDFEVIGRLD